MDNQDLNNDTLIEEAIDLVLRVHEDPENAVTRDLVNRWRARSADHEDAWLEVMEIHGMASTIIQNKRTLQNNTPIISRRGFIKAGVAGLAVVGAGAMFGPAMMLQARADYLTSTAELRPVQLLDGSSMLLGPDSAVAIQFDERQRQIELLAGMAYFDVALDQARPFSVKTGDFYARSADAAFDISHDAGYFYSSVDRGQLNITVDTMVTLQAGDWLSLDPDRQGFERGGREAGQIATWRDGLLVAERETIASVVSRIARWQMGKVLIAQRGFGENRISGTFNLHTPLAALEAVVEPYGGKVRQFSPLLTIIAPF